MLKDFDPNTWDVSIGQLMQEGHDALAETPEPSRRAALLIANVKIAISCKLERRGFDRLMRSFVAEPEFLTSLADQLVADEQPESLVTELSRVLDAIHSHAPQEFHPRARMILNGQSVGCVRAAAAALRVYSDNATIEDIAQIKAFLAYPDAWVKGLALHAIAYMGNNVHLRSELLDAALSVDVAGNAYVATQLADAFGPYGIPLSSLSPQDAARLLGQFLPIEDFDTHQGKLPRFLSQLGVIFPDEVLDLLLARIEKEHVERRQKNWGYHALGHAYANVSFGSVEAAARLQLAKRCLDVYLMSEGHPEAYAKLFWTMNGADDEILGLIVSACDSADEQGTAKIGTLIKLSSKRLAFTQPNFAKKVLVKISGPSRQKMIEAFVRDALSHSAGAFQGEPHDYFEQQRQAIKAQVEALPKDKELADLADALKRSIGHLS
jgi:hypothetical protein